MQPAQDPNRIEARPTKTFFVQTITRDIELKDAILDLLDNCIDGLMRSLPKGVLERGRPYSGHWAHITFNKDMFSIEDNCGGIDKNLARTSAFRMGRVELATDSKGTKLPTVGAYGIGMKRAIFKMGDRCTVTSRTRSDAYQVVISPQWLKDDFTWDLRMTPAQGNSKITGTRIEVRNLREQIRRQFININGFEEDLHGAVSQQFAIVLKKGFQVKINGTAVKPRPFRFISVDLANYEKGVAPFLFRGNIDGVQVDLSVGFYKPVPDPADLEDEEEEQGTFSANESGWNVICNDRVVLTHDTTYLTGWGTGGVPSFHNQFIAIAGTVRFTAVEAFKLPLTTTKRGVDLNSELYQRVLAKMQEGVMHFTAFTNRLKKSPSERKKVFRETSSIDLEQLEQQRDSAKLTWHADRKLVGGETFKPVLPTPDEAVRVIRFSKPKEEIKAVAEFLFKDESVRPSEVGGACFDRVHKEAARR